MTLDSIWKRRQQLHLKKFSRYSKYIFNDHFVLVLLFLLGALAYQYSEFVKAVTPDFLWGKLLIVAIFSGSIFIAVRTVTIAIRQIYQAKSDSPSVSSDSFLFMAYS